MSCGSYGKLPESNGQPGSLGVRHSSSDLPTFELASVKLGGRQLGYEQAENAHLFRVVLFPEDGLPTRPIRGSRGMTAYV